MAKKGANRANGRNTRAAAAASVPDVYSDMLLETVVSAPSHFAEEGRPLKKRRTGKRGSPVPKVEAQAESAERASGRPDSPASQGARRQTAYESDQSESDVDWEEVDVQGKDDDGDEDDDTPGEDGGDDALDLVLGQEINTSRAIPAKRKPLTADERRARLEIHKMHILCLMAHVDIRNSWCNDVEVHVRYFVCALILGS